MGVWGNRRLEKARSFLGGLTRDVRANTLAMMAMALIPLAGMVGGGVDISRMYIVKTRLQHACDAGALAGRKAMGGGTWAYNNYYPRTSAEKFFDANYNSAAYGASNVTRSFTESSGKVTGTASATLPMTLMRIFGRTTETLSVVCDADMRLPNTDVMFVLDTTGSMDETPSGDSQTKISGLRVAVKCFYEIVARLDTDASCTTGTPSGGTGNQVQIRFGFVPYSTNVNVGRLLKTDWVANNWFYQTRQLVSGGTGGTGSWGDWDGYGWVSCSSIPANTSTVQYRTVGTFWSYCNLERRLWGTSGGSSTAYWKYDRLSLNISGLKNGTEWNDNFTLNIGNNGAAKTIAWDGCIEERATVQTTDFSPIPSGAKDLDIDSTPTTDDTTKWKPALPGVIYTRKSTGNSGTNNWDRDAVNNTNQNYSNASSYYCPTEAKKLQTWTSATAFDDYVDSLRPEGNTYHDIGLLWGARLVSSTGLFASENAYTPQGGEIERHIIFMTDGDTNTSSSDYNAYGIPWFDRRQTTSTSQADLDSQVDKRFAAICTAIKNKNITLWVISFGTVSSDTEDRLEACASSSRYFSASNSAALQTTFKSIADQISQLRLTR